MLKIRNIHIKGIGPIKDLELTFNPHFNIICGANGIGKTTILDCIAETFIGNEYNLRKNTSAENGEWITSFQDSQEEPVKSKVTRVTEERPSQNGDRANWNFTNDAKNVLYYKTNRSITYESLTSIIKDPELQEYQYYNLLRDGSNYREIKQWFVNRYVWSNVPGELSQVEIDNLDSAKKVFSLMAEGFSLDRVEHETNDIILNTPKGKIVFEQLSSGFISFAIIFLGLIKDIEYRFKNPHIRVSDFDGILIIDELDVHLHPELQAKVYQVLERLLPNAQIFTSTHSPHIIQVAKAHEIIPLVSTPDGNVKVNPIVNEQYGCQGWTIEEILTDVMGMADTRSHLYKEETQKFNDAINRDDKEAAKLAFDKLDKMLHPDNILREVMKVQLL